MCYNSAITPTMPHKEKTTASDNEKKPKTKGRVEMPVRPTVAIKHKHIVEDMGKGKTLTEAAQKQGYSKAYAQSGNITKTKSWKQILNLYLPEEKLLKVHDQQLNSYKLQSMLMQKQIDEEIIYELIESIGAVLKRIVEIPTGKVVFYITADNQSRNKALELGLKLHKRLTDKVEVRDTTPYTQLTDAQLAQRIKEGKSFFLKKK